MEKIGRMLQLASKRTLATECLFSRGRGTVVKGTRVLSCESQYE